MYLGFSAKSVVLLFELNAAMPAADTAIQKKKKKKKMDQSQ